MSRSYNTTQILIEDNNKHGSYVRMDELRTKDNNYFKKVRGSDPGAATCRGKLQYRRSKLNQEITKQMMMRNGAEKLFKATANKKHRETVALELSFVNSNLQLLKEQLAEMNSSVHVYQSENYHPLVPMIPLGLKETKDIDFKEPFTDCILEHYSEDATKYENIIRELVDTRQAIRTPTRDKAGVRLLFEYYNQLYYIDRRFFSPNRNLPIFFEWFDSLTGVPSTQKTIAFEKASILFNIAALYTQIGAKQDRTKATGVDAAVDSFLRAAGMFRYIRENFSNAPSMDLGPSTLETLTHLMLAQARECLFEKLLTQNHPTKKPGIEISLETAQEAAEVCEVYGDVHKLISSPPVKDYVPISWISLISVKSEHYRALAHHYAGMGLLQHSGELNEIEKQCLEFLHSPEDDELEAPICIDIRVPQNPEERRQLGKAHLREAVWLHEEALRLLRLCPQLRKADTLQERLTTDRDESLEAYEDLQDEDDFRDTLNPPRIQASTKYQLSLTLPDINQYKVKDLFHNLGPISIFSARHYWSAPRTVHLEKTKTLRSFGFSVRGDAPVIVAGVDLNGMADLVGMKEGDFIVGINSKETKWSNHEEVVKLIRDCEDKLTLKVITPMDRNYLQPKSMETPTPSRAPSMGILNSGNGTISYGSRSLGRSTDKLNHSQKKMTWNIFRRSTSKERKLVKDDNLLFR